jgi:hypothetical protein
MRICNQLFPHFLPKLIKNRFLPAGLGGGLSGRVFQSMSQMMMLIIMTPMRNINIVRSGVASFWMDARAAGVRIGFNASQAMMICVEWRCKGMNERW